MKKSIAGVLLTMTTLLTQAQQWTSARLSQQTEKTSVSNFHKIPIKKNKKAGESDFYVRVFGNYSLAAFSSYRLEPTTPSNYTYTYNQSGAGVVTTKTETKYSSNMTGLGQGIRAGLGFGYIVSDFINLGLDTDYYLGYSTKSNTNYSYTYTYPSGSVPTYNSGGENSEKATMLVFSPNIMFKAVTESKTFFYNKAGLCIGLVNMTGKQTSGSQSVTDLNNYSTTTTTREYEYDGGLSLGFTSSLGMQTQLTDALFFFGEIQYVSIGYKPTKKTMTKILTTTVSKSGSNPAKTTITDNLSGTVQVDNGPVTPTPSVKYKLSQIETDYSKEYTTITTYDSSTGTTTTSPTTDEPTKEKTKRVPINSLGIQFGLLFRF